MRKLALLLGLSAIFLAVPATAAPLIASHPAAMPLLQDGDVVLVKKKAKARPPGWSRGRKVGWRGGSVPPGHQKKKYRF